MERTIHCQAAGRIECFDISHNQGRNYRIHGCVRKRAPSQKEYRRFKLQSTQGTPDDFKSMAEVMARRYGIETKWPRPDLIVLDGGKGQLDAALPVIRSCGIDTPVIGLAKRMEEIYVEGQTDRLS
ncbi:MAG: hypothetical protein ACLUIQ_01535 [Dialister invisus]